MAFVLQIMALLQYDKENYAKVIEITHKKIKGVSLDGSALRPFDGTYIWSLIELGELKRAEEEIKFSEDNIRERMSQEVLANTRAIINDARAMLQRAEKQWDESIEYFEGRIQQNEAGAFVGTNYYFARHILFECARACLERNKEGDKQRALDLLHQALVVFQKLGSKKEIERVKERIAFIQSGQEHLKIAGPESTGYAILDELLCGGIPANYAVALSSPSCDERDSLIKTNLEAGVGHLEPTFYLAFNPDLSGFLAQEYPTTFYLFVCNPQAEASFKASNNVFLLKGVGNLTNINIVLTSAIRQLNTVAQKGPKRICIDIISDVLLQHGPFQTRKWLSELLMQLRTNGFTTIALLDPRMHPSDQLYAVLSLFDGEVNIREAETDQGLVRFLKVRRMSNTNYIKEERRLSQE
jgi:KaiC/GvpD/RAD55 family RecA-like ATPase